MMGGQVWVESQEGKGSIFHFTIRAPCLLDSPPQWFLPRHEQFNGRVAWVVSGSVIIRSQLYDMLTLWGMTVHAMSTSTQVLTAIDLLVVEDEPSSHRPLVVREGEFRRPDIILTSLFLQAGAKSGPRTVRSPNGSNIPNEHPYHVDNDGMKLSERIRERFTKRELPIILMCALNERKQEAKSIVNGFGNQPIKPGQLFKAILAALRSDHAAILSTTPSPSHDTKNPSPKQQERVALLIARPSSKAPVQSINNDNTNLNVSTTATASPSSSSSSPTKRTSISSGHIPLLKGPPNVSVTAIANVAVAAAASALPSTTSPEIPIVRTVRAKVERVIPIAKRSLCILVVEDNIVNQKVIRQVLKMQVLI
jgi:CheY-like chemotaxis protein